MKDTEKNCSKEISTMLNGIEKEVLEIELSSVKRSCFSDNPRKYLSNAGLDDPLCSFAGKTMLFSEAVSSAEETARLPVARTLVRRLYLATTKMEDDPESVPTGVPIPLALANALAFFNAMYLANANYWYNANWTGYSPNIAHDSLVYSVIDFDEDYIKNNVFHAFDDQGYSLARQGAVLKTLIVSSLGENPKEGDHLVTYSYNGLTFEVGFTYTSEKINVKNAVLIQNHSLN